MFSARMAGPSSVPRDPLAQSAAGKHTRYVMYPTESRLQPDVKHRSTRATAYAYRALKHLGTCSLTPRRHLSIFQSNVAERMYKRVDPAGHAALSRSLQCCGGAFPPPRWWKGKETHTKRALQNFGSNTKPTTTTEVSPSTETGTYSKRPGTPCGRLPRSVARIRDASPRCPFGVRASVSRTPPGASSRSGSSSRGQQARGSPCKGGPAPKSRQLGYTPSTSPEHQ